MSTCTNSFDKKFSKYLSLDHLLWTADAVAEDAAAVVAVDDGADQIGDEEGLDRWTSSTNGPVLLPDSSRTRHSIQTSA